MKSLEHAGGYLVGEHYRFCDNGDILNLSVVIQQQHPATLACKTGQAVPLRLSSY